MYFITVLTKDGKSSRCWGYKKEYSEALDCVRRNVGSMSECLYDYLVIEQIGEGIIGPAKCLAWFIWAENKNNESGWVECDSPAWASGVTNFVIG